MSDAGPMAMRRLLLTVVRDVMYGKDPLGLARGADDDRFSLDLVHAVVPSGVSWRDPRAVEANLLETRPPTYI